MFPNGLATTHATSLLLWICKLHQSVDWRYNREDPTESFQSCSTVWLDLCTNKDLVPVSRILQERRLIDAKRWSEVIFNQTHVDTIFSFCKFWFFFTQILYHFHLLLSFWFKWFNSVRNFETKSTRVQSRLKMVLWPLIGIDGLFLRMASVADMSKVEGLKHCTKMWATDGHFPTKKWIHCSSMCDFRA